MRIIAFTGPKYSGKDTAAKALFNASRDSHKNYFRRAPMAEGVKNICHETFGYPYSLMEDPVAKEQPTDEWPHIAPRWPMMDIANWMRDKYGGDVWARRWERLALQTTGWGAHVITDLRFPADELPMIRRYDSLVIYIGRDQAEEALEKAQQAGDPMALNPSEANYSILRREADVIITNNGSIENLHGQVYGVVRNKFGYWGYWDNVDRDIVHQLRMGELEHG